MLAESPLPYYHFRYDNLPSTPSLTPGTSVTPSTSGYGSWTQFASSSNIAADCYALQLFICNAATSGANRNLVIEIGIDPAGGTTYTAVVTDLMVSKAGTGSANGTLNFILPIFIPAGSSVAIRGYSTAATAFAVVGSFFGRPSRPEMAPKGMRSETLGISTTNGTTFTPGIQVMGSWTSLGTTSFDMWWWQPCVNLSSSGFAAEYCYCEFAWGDSSNKHPLGYAVLIGSTAEEQNRAALPSMVREAAQRFVPSGSTIYVRGMADSAPLTTYQASITGIG